MLKKKMNRREVIKKYKNSIQQMGIVQVRNITNNRAYLTASANTGGIEYHRLQVWSNKMIEKAVHP
jgi:membrane-bound lytic murein transglycosylase MltF